MNNNKYQMKVLMERMAEIEGRIYASNGEIDKINKVKARIGKKIRLTRFFVSCSDGMGQFFFWLQMFMVTNWFGHLSNWLRLMLVDLHHDLNDRIEHERELLQNHVDAVRCRAWIQMDILEHLRIMNSDLAREYSTKQMKDINHALKACQSYDLIGSF